jgi:hypothetical protein
MSVSISRARRALSAGHKTLTVPLLHLHSSVTWQKQARYGEVSKPIRIGHSIRHKVQKLLPDGKSQLAIVGIIAEGVIRP